MYRYYKTLRFWESSVYLFIRIHVAQAGFNLCTAGDPVLLSSPPKGVYCHTRLSQVYFVFCFRIGYKFFFSGRGCHRAWKFRFICIYDQCPVVIKELSCGLVEIGFPLLLPNPAFLDLFFLQDSCCPGWARSAGTVLALTVPKHRKRN